jgi:hypothetical protein
MREGKGGILVAAGSWGAPPSADRSSSGELGLPPPAAGSSSDRWGTGAHEEKAGSGEGEEGEGPA